MRPHPVAAAGLERAGRAREVLVLEVARVAAAWLAQRDERVDLAAIQRLIVAQRLA